MKKVLYTVFALAALVLASCSNKVDLYEDDGEHTIVYAMLDASIDTNFVKITKSFLGNANELAYNYDANNYKYGEIEVKLTGKFDGSNSTQTITLDTTSRWIPYDPEATFYTGCRQTYYFTSKKLVEGEEYQLDVLRKADNVSISAKATTINSFIYQKPNANVPIIFADYAASTNTVEWKVPVAPFKSTAAYFEVTGYFNYKELQPGAQDTVSRSITWQMGGGDEASLYNTSASLPYYVITYTQSTLYTLIENDKYLKENSPLGVQRWVDNFVFKITAVGEELYNYNLITNSSSAIQDVPNYTNINNGYGIMSSRVTKPQTVKVSVKTQNKIHEKFENYGFPHVYQ